MSARDRAELDAGLDEVRAAPKDGGRVELVIRRPSEGEREVLAEATLDVVEGVVGDRWAAKPNPLTQVTLMSARSAALIARDRQRWPLAGDQLYVDLDLSCENLPAGTRLTIGTATLEITDKPHTGCGKFIRRFGVDAMKLVNSEVGRELNLRGINSRVVAAGVVRPGDRIAKVS